MTETAPPYRYVDSDDFCLSARLLPDLDAGGVTDTLSITIEGSDEPQSVHVPAAGVPAVAAGIVAAAGHLGADQPNDPEPRRPFDARAGLQRLADEVAQGGPGDDRAVPADAVPPAPADRATVYAEVAERLSADAEQGAKDGFTRIYRRSAAEQVREWGDELRRLADEAQPVSPAYARLKAAAHAATEAAHLHAMHGMRRAYRLALSYGTEPIPPAEVLNALGLDENANAEVLANPQAAVEEADRG